MIYIISTKSELNNFRIWQGHYSVILDALDSLQLRYCFKDLSDVSNEFLPTDTVINIGNHQYCSGELLRDIGDKLSKCQFIGIIDDWKSPLPTQIRKQVKGILISNIHEPPLHLKSFEWVQEHYYLNVNRASYNPLPLKPVGEGFIYWGSFRPKRTRYFDKYFKGVIVSASDRAHNRFSEYYNYRAIGKLNIPQDLQDFGYTIYFHDIGQPKQSPANRYYEAVSAGLPVFFDSECTSHFGDEIKPWIIDYPEDVEMFNLTSVQHDQRAFLSRYYKMELIEEMKSLLEKILCK